MLFQQKKEGIDKKTTKDVILIKMYRICQKKNYKGVEKVKNVRVNTFKGEFETLKMNDLENAVDYYNWVIVVVNSLKSN